jgi:hypothetical protein
MFQVFPGNWIRGGDFTDLDYVLHNTVGGPGAR